MSEAKSDGISLQWTDIDKAAEEMARVVQPRFADLLHFFAPAADCCKRLIYRGDQVTDESAQKTLALYHAVQAFRTAVAATRISLGGYADVAAGLARTVWELQLRLATIRRGGELRALAELYIATSREIRSREASIADDGDDEARRALQTWLDGRADLIQKAEHLGVDEAALRRVGKTTVAAMAFAEGQQLEYDFWYSLLSQMHHGGRAFATYRYMRDVVTDENGMLLSVDDHTETMIGSALEYLFRALTQSALIFREHFLAVEIDRIHSQLGPLILKVFPEGAA